MNNESSAEDLYDYEGPAGRVQIILQRTRWRWLLAGILALTFAIPFIIAHLSIPSVEEGNYLGVPVGVGRLILPPQQLPLKERGGRRESSGVQQTTEFKANGNPGMGKNFLTAEIKKNFTDFDGLASFCNSSNGGNGTVSVSNFFLDADRFSKVIQACTGLESLILENIWLLGNFSRVQLPHLRRFQYVQNPGDKRDSYKSLETLRETLFFDLGGNWNVPVDLLNFGVDIQISKGGTKLLDIRRKDGVIFLNVKYCEDVLKGVQGTFESLTLINCNVTEESLKVIPGDLKYLNLRNSVQRTPILADLMRKQKTLEEFYLWLTFHCDWPGYELYLNLNDLPPSLKTLGINNADLIVQNASSSIKELTIGDYTTPSAVLDFPKVWGSGGLQRLNIVNVSDPSPAAGYEMILKGMQLGVEEIAVVNLKRNYSAVLGQEGNAEEVEGILEVEGVLDRAGIAKTENSFVLKSSNGLYVGRELNSEERHQVRYKGLGFDQMDSLQDYLKWDALQ